MRLPFKMLYRSILSSNTYYLCFITVCLLGTIIYLICDKLEERRWEIDPVIIHWGPPDKDISCYSILKGDGLPSVEDPSFSPGQQSIFFHETSCRGGIDSRQACSVESAARAHPDWEVYLLFNSPVSPDMLRVSSLSKLLEFPNIKVARVHASAYAKDSIVHSIVNKRLNKSLHPIEHTADIMRLLTLKKWGGVYLDLDQVVVKSFDMLPSNWIAKESNEDVSSGAMAFSKDEIGKNMINAFLKEIFESYEPRDLTFNGPQAITRVLNRICPNAISKPGNCKGVSILGPKLFYPIHYSWAFVYFQESDGIETNDSYAYHLWNMITKVYRVKMSSLYAKLAKRYCPSIYKMYGKDFGV